MSFDFAAFTKQVVERVKAYLDRRIDEASASTARDIETISAAQKDAQDSAISAIADIEATFGKKLAALELKYQKRIDALAETVDVERSARLASEKSVDAAIKIATDWLKKHESSIGDLEQSDDASKEWCNETARCLKGLLEDVDDLNGAVSDINKAEAARAQGLAIVADQASNVAAEIERVLASVAALEKMEVTDGQDGKDAFEIAREYGFEGTRMQWLESLAGRPGESAYELAQNAGFKGTMIEFLNSLKGETGDTGKSAYEIAVHCGFEGTEKQFSQSLSGKDGASAFEIAVQNGFTGDEKQWLRSFKGDAGKSAFDIAVDHGFEGTEKQFAAALIGKDGASAFEIAVKNGFEGDEKQWLRSLNGADGLGVGQFFARKIGDRDFEIGFENVSGKVAKTLHFDVPIFRGAFSEARRYEKSDIVTHGGSWHIALASTKQSPKDDPQRWRLTVKRGINGKDGPEGPVGPPGRPGVDLTPAGLMQSGPLEP